ncbi:MAG: S26 family signal peptidase, partial [Planctomycetota bacterium]|nr:S26 family signal peptidase [Planctomycetota bacterium]
GVLRIELDGEPIETRPLARPGKNPWVTVFAEHGAELVEFSVARDLHWVRPHGFRPVAVGDAAVFLLGDNSVNSRDSRHFGTIDTRALVGRGWAVAWPPSRVRLLR